MTDCVCTTVAEALRLVIEDRPRVWRPATFHKAATALEAYDAAKPNCAAIMDALQTVLAWVNAVDQIHADAGETYSRGAVGNAAVEKVRSALNGAPLSK